MNQIELIVGLKIPDSIAITAFHTLEKLGFKELKKLKREDYYKFTTDEDFKTFSKKISKVDILVNANKNKYITKKVDEGFKEESNNLKTIKILVSDIDDGAKTLLSTLQQRLGFKQIKAMEKGMLWTLYLETKNKQEAALIAEKITKKLLYNEHYQKYRIL